jgi:hypothetical protein
MVLQPIEPKIPASEIATANREKRFFSDLIVTSYVVISPAIGESKRHTNGILTARFEARLDPSFCMR